MYVLGVGGYMHDYNCCLIDVGGKRVAMAEAERFSRSKHHVVRGEAEVMAPVRVVCDSLGINPRKIDVVVHGHADPFQVKEWLKNELPKARHVEVDHHLCHAAGAFYSSAYDKALIVSIDGFGDGSSGVIASGDGMNISEVTRISDADSIGLEYLRATYHLGLGGYGAEGKTQGLAPYGEPTVFDDYMNEIRVTADGNIILSDRLKSQSSTLAVEGGYLNTQILTNRFLDDYGPRRITPEPLTKDHNNLAASVQKMLEHVIGEVCLNGKSKTGHDALVVSGGVMMNSSLNGRLLESGAFKGIYALPMASDRGIGLGAALYYVHAEIKVPRFFELDTVFFGGTCSDKAAAKAMKKAGIRPFVVDDIHGYAAEALSEGKIIGWVQGRSEMGARALGHRSILADPGKAEMKDIINQRVKHREWFRPFAPAVLAEKAEDYFDFPEGVADLSFMTFTVKAKDKAVDDAAAAIHVDKTARVQTVDEERNPDLHKLISRFDKLTGVPILLNTSFNDNNEPIVETEADAVKTFMKTDMDVLCIGNVVGVKN
ncbi:MAG: hypothetical protein A3G18_08750 [Rhodospirillales bacterium RIFCSPLOWO2_12_FULL_58_28]|nr:MAG: hypothetical protein A3H92_00305 [Rhodospirillales bacterium RIFCSPLOWO2_02_FULL_58_16]OHC79783.1 MAG: hypothetical protein A3G18_08750 [Rhodospirillales bacterium RIFCSPLOWO2_12_FULL_58_28]